MATVHQRKGAVIGKQYGIHLEVSVGLHKSVLCSHLKNFSGGDCWPLLSTYNRVCHTQSSASCYLILVIVLIAFYHPCFIDVETGGEMLSNVLKIIQLASGKAGFRPKLGGSS